MTLTCHRGATSRELAREQPRRWLVTGAAGFIGSHLRRGAARARPAVSSASTTSPRGTAQPRRRPARGGRGRVVAASASSRATSATSTSAGAPARGSTWCCTRRRSARCRARSHDPLATHEANVNGFLNVLVGRARRRRPALRLRQLQLRLRRPPGAAQGRGRDRPAAVAVRRDQASTSSTPTYSRAATASSRRPALLQRLRAAAGSRTAPMPRSSRAGSRRCCAASRCSSSATARPSRDFCYVDNVVQACVRAGFLVDDAAVSRGACTPYGAVAFGIDRSVCASLHGGLFEGGHWQIVRPPPCRHTCDGDPARHRGRCRGSTAPHHTAAWKSGAGCSAGPSAGRCGCRMPV